jgi:superfamily II DNA or RNA helicase
MSENYIKFEEQKKTLIDALRLLEDKNKCMVSRCTGFGKTYIAVELINYFKNVLYVYPAKIIKATVEERYNEIDLETSEVKELLTDKCDMITYNKISRMSISETKEISHKKYDLIIFDECHKMGGNKCMINIMRILNNCKKYTKYIGLTATPIRTDGIDISSIFFNNTNVYPYNLIDAINDGIIQMPNYVYCKYDAKLPQKFKDTMLNINNKYTNKDDTRYGVIKRKIFEIMSLDQIKMSDVIGEYCTKYVPDTNCMKFLVFFSSIKQMDEDFDDVISWFQDAFTDHSVEILRISSKNKEESEDVAERLNKLTVKDKTIYLIGSIDMLNLGYHVEKTGIVMYRGTSSNIIYSQQFGRTLSAGESTPELVFDVVDNIHRKAIYELRPDNYKRRNGMYLTNFELDKYNNLVMYDIDNYEWVKTFYHMLDDGTIVDDNGVPTNLIYDPKTSNIYEKRDNKLSDSKDPNRISKECLNPVGNVATDKEILAKIEAEVLAQQCKWVLEAHFRSWCFNQNILYPLSKKELEKFYNKDKSEFYNWFKGLLRRKKIKYPINNVKELLYIGKGSDYLDTSFEICAAKKDIAVSKVLEVLGIA